MACNVLIWGYPIDGTSSALNMLGMLNGTPWAKQLSRENADALMNFFPWRQLVLSGRLSFALSGPKFL